MQLVNDKRLLSFLSIFILIVGLFYSNIAAQRHRYPHHQGGHFSRQKLQEIQKEELYTENSLSKIFCAHGAAVGGRCICDQGWAGTNCQREMHCATFERNPNGSCPICQSNFQGDKCEYIECQNGGEELLETQSCTCPMPYSGRFCDELHTRNVATLGPLGLLSVIPMICLYVLCERFARKRQVKRIEKTWNLQSTKSVNPANIELLLREKS
uniref:EGF-like domain-containing protein n=1 Tax=Meloidogyne hapla TaxID=6305 RepID=A0A1I8BPK2_MELHA